MKSPQTTNENQVVYKIKYINNTGANSNTKPSGPGMNKPMKMGSSKSG